jgi:cytidine deaminase
MVARLADAAWSVRERSRLVGKTAVGCAVLSSGGHIYAGCNVEHRFRSHDIHAEVNALSSMVAGGADTAILVFVAAERERFTPCGACLDWIFELGGADCEVWVHNGRDATPTRYTARELMPYYPR